MNISLFPIGAGRATQPEVLARIARKAEEVGFESLFAPEPTVVFPPEQYTSVYPYSAERLQDCVGTPPYSTPCWRSPGPLPTPRRSGSARAFASCRSATR